MGFGTARSLKAFLFVCLVLGIPIKASAETLGGDDSRLKIHGFLSQAWAKTDGEQYLGITKDGTFNYRNLALQLRFQLAEKQSLVFQLGHESRGESPRDAFRDEIELDWAFYEARLSNMSVRVGRIPLPLGIYSELRDAGHLLPFYGPPIIIYGETSFASDSIDGVGLTFNFFRESPWNVDLDVFAGESSFSEKSRTGAFQVAQTRNDWGLRLWLNTPVEGLRLGFNHHSFEIVSSVVLLSNATQPFNYMSVDFTRERWLVRSEFGRGKFALPFLEADVKLGYVTVGVSPLPRFWVYLQGEKRDTSITPKVQADRTSHKSLGISLTYAITDRVVAKAEYSDFDTVEVDRPVNPIEIPKVKATILSLSVAF